MSNKVDRKFRKLSIGARIDALLDAGIIDADDAERWLSEAQRLESKAAERMIENVIGTFSLPQGLAINFPLNGRSYAVPMVLEEPSVVAALSYTALLAEKSGGFSASVSAPVLIGQVQLTGITDLARAERAVEDASYDVIQTANTLIPKMVSRGGGVKKVSAHSVVGPITSESMLIVHLLVDTRDAMGANIVNTVCEGIAPLLESITGGHALLKILSNLADTSLAVARVSFSPKQLATKNYAGEDVRDRIVLANDFALADPYRAATHNKGIMNGIDPLAIATGNDWRSIEAAAHAYACRSGSYRALTQWSVAPNGDLSGQIELPIKVGTVGASLQTNPAVAMNQRLLGISDAMELAGLMAAVGLAQNFAALRALTTDGIQKGHMTLHARSVALSAGVPDALFDKVVAKLVDEGEIKVWRAQELVAELQGGAHER